MRTQGLERIFENSSHFQAKDRGDFMIRNAFGIESYTDPYLSDLTQIRGLAFDRYSDGDCWIRPEFWGTDLGKRYKELERKSHATFIANSENYKINQQVLNDLGTLKTTQYAIDKTNYLISKMAQFSRDFGITSNELYFYMTGENNSGNNNLIDDVHLSLDQRVTPSICNAMDPIGDSMEIQSQGKQIMCWGHSHADLSTFNSPTDDSNIHVVHNDMSSARDFEYDSGGNIKIEAGIKHLYGMVFNNNQDAPALRLVSNRPRYIFDGEFKIVQETFDIESTPSGLSNENNINNYLEQEIIDDGRRLTDAEKSQLDNLILDRVSVEENGEWIKLRDIYRRQNLSLVSRPIQQGPLAGGCDHHNQYDQQLENDIQIPSTGYFKEDMCNYYSLAENSTGSVRGVYSVIGKILAGDYMGSLDQLKRGNLEETQRTRSLGTWEKRTEAVREIVNHYELDPGCFDSKLICQVLSKNKYLCQYHNNKFLEIKDLLIGNS